MRDTSPCVPQKSYPGDGPTMIILFAMFVLSLFAGAAEAGNLSCYQCTKKTPEPCPEDTLLPCPHSKDRCVSHYSKDAINGYIMKKECGLGPCGFEDDMVNRGLGLADQCDTSKDEFFCVFCCRESGCNGAERFASLSKLLIISLVTMVFFARNELRILA